MVARAKVSPAEERRLGHRFGEAPKDVNDVACGLSTGGGPFSFVTLLTRDESICCAEGPHTVSFLFTAGTRIWTTEPALGR